VILTSASETTAIGEQLARLAAGGDAIALVGDLGAGKTTLVAGLVAALGAGIAASPTFSLVNEYRGGRLIVWHVDLYRIERAAELVELGLDVLIGDRRGRVVVAWADKFGVMPPDHLRLVLEYVPEGRRLEVTGTGPRGQVLAAALGSP
jgi:tRNA threonylcarbamoyladenosine biosynthesis protein TsaE